MAADISVTKIHLSADGKVTAAFTMPSKKNPDEQNRLTFESDDMPEASFTRALDALREDVGFLFFAGDCPKDVTIRGATFRYKDTRLACIITAVRPCPASNSPCVINTPLVWTTDDDADVGMPDAMRKRVRKVIAESERYINGERAQLMLALGGKEAAA